MKALIIIIEILFGQSHTIITENYILSYTVYSENLDTQKSYRLFDRNSNIEYHIDSELKVTRSFLITDDLLKGRESNIEILESEVIEKDFNYLEFKGRKVRRSVRVANILKGKGSGVVFFEHVFSPLCIIDKYVENLNHKRMLSSMKVECIDNSYEYSVLCHEVSGMKPYGDNMLIHKLLKIYEEDIDENYFIKFKKSILGSKVAKP